MRWVLLVGVLGWGGMAWADGPACGGDGDVVGGPCLTGVAGQQALGRLVCGPAGPVCAPLPPAIAPRTRPVIRRAAQRRPVVALERG